MFDRNANELGRAVAAGQIVRTSLALDVTGVTPPVRIPSYLFRVPIVVPTNATDFIATVIPDDGFVLYVNGREVFRLGVPVAADLFASFGGVHISPETAVQQVFAIPTTNFITGTNVLAVLLKQFNSSSPDVTFGLRLTAVVDPRFVVVDPQPARQPQSTMAVEGHRWSMDVFYPSDFSLIYQWFHDGVEVAGANTETITGVATASDAGAYWVVIGSVAGAITSAPAISSPAIGNWHTVTWRSDPFWELVQGGDVAGAFTPVNVPGV